MNKHNAIGYLEDLLTTCDCIRFHLGKYDEAIEIAISALEKQIPKKPEWNLQNDAILCPCCGLDLMGGVEIDSEIDPEHCWNCGQAIDWRNEDE